MQQDLIINLTRFNLAKQRLIFWESASGAQKLVTHFAAEKQFYDFSAWQEAFNWVHQDNIFSYIVSQFETATGGIWVGKSNTVIHGVRNEKINTTYPANIHYKNYTSAIASARQRIAQGLALIQENKLKKIVISEKLTIEGQFDWVASIYAIRQAYKHVDILLFSDGAGNIILSASPERLLTYEKDTIYIDCVAGTAPKDKNDLEADKRKIAEHDYVIEGVSSALLACGLQPQLKDRHIKRMGNSSHLCQIISAPFHPSNQPSFGHLVAALHPTPAVGGWPKTPALQAIKHIENDERGHYAGIIGWYDPINQQSVLNTCIRAVEKKENDYYLRAGVGLVSGSDPDEEINEIELKWKMVLNILSSFK